MIDACVQFRCDVSTFMHVQLEQGIKKTGETIQIVKTVLAMKLQSEQKQVSIRLCNIMSRSYSTSAVKKAR